MLAITSAIRQVLRPFFVTVLAFMMLSITSAHVRATVMVKLQENGVQRFYETEVLHHHGAEIRMAQQRLGRKPIEARPMPAASVAWPPAPAIVRAIVRPSSPRAPPHQPRAPPTA